MRAFNKTLLLSALLGAALLAGAGPSSASGMQPRASAVVILESEGEAEMLVRNTDATASLLYTAVVDLPEGPEALVIATPAVARVEPGDEQLVRFVYEGPPLTTQVMKRVTFEGIGAERDNDGQVAVGVGVRYDLPMILHPKGLAENNAPWEQLAWTRTADALLVSNATPYVVRLQPSAVLMPSKTEVGLPRPYILPGEQLRLPVTGAGGDSTVVLQPVGLYGFAAGPYTAPVK